MKTFKDIYDYKHLTEIIENSRQNLIVEHLKYSDILEFKDMSIRGLKPNFYLKSLKSIKFRKIP